MQTFSTHWPPVLGWNHSKLLQFDARYSGNSFALFDSFFALADSAFSRAALNESGKKLEICRVKSPALVYEVLSENDCRLKFDIREGRMFLEEMASHAHGMVSCRISCIIKSKLEAAYQDGLTEDMPSVTLAGGKMSFESSARHLD